MAAGDLLTVTTYSYPSYVQTITLDGVDYVMSMKWNQRCSLWYLTLADSSGNLLVDSIGISCVYPILLKFQYLGVPQGLLVALPSGSDDSSPGVTDFGEGLRTTLFYVASV